MIDNKKHLSAEGIEEIRSLRNALKMRKDSLDALDAHVQWGVE